MLIEKTLVLPAPIQKVWDTVMDIEAVANCFPGVESVEMIDEKTYRSVVKSKVAYITAAFDLTTIITAIEPPIRLETQSEGKDKGLAGRMTQKQVLELKAISPEETEAVYKAEVSISGRLATFGQKIIRAKADQMADQFAERFTKLLAGETEAPVNGSDFSAEADKREGGWRARLGKIL
ncbi:MAG: SRPBCC domain-containing protein [Chloroflexi bacterium]|nr:SRPBCC domain-containing protein [Chloroflexota bacterium]